MNLIVDIGNTATKLAVFNSNDIVHTEVVTGMASPEHVQAVLDQYPDISKGIIASVVRADHALRTFVQNRLFLLTLSHQTATPVANKYESPTTLGLDRLAAVAGAQATFPQKDALVIDMGTCITYDLLLASGEYFGGSISPGLNIRFKSVNTFTSKLPLVERENEFTLIGTTTETAIRSGVQNGIVAEVDGVIEEYKRLYPGLRVLLTGGDGSFFEKELKSSIFADPNLVLRGLNAILEFNEDN